MHNKLWFKIHLILGLTAGIILLVIGLTGSILSFEKEILKLINKDSYVVKVLNEKKLTTKEILERFQEKFPEAKINGIIFSKDMTSTMIINIAGGEGRAARRGIDYILNPYTAEILENIKGHDFFKFIENIHRRLALGDIGKQITAISVLSLLVLLFSGIYIYWSRIKKAFFKSITFNFKYKGRAFLSTMHSAIGIWVIPFYLLASLTGLYWSYDWYNEALHKISGVEKQKRTPMNKPSKIKNDSNTLLVQLDEIQEIVELFDATIKEYSNANLRFNHKKGIYTITYLNANAAHDRAKDQISLDINTKEIVKHEKFEDKPLNERLMKSILALHTGAYFGLFGQIAMFITSLLMTLFTITGFMMYFQRKKKKKIV